MYVTPPDPYRREELARDRHQRGRAVVAGEPLKEGDEVVEVVREINVERGGDRGAVLPVQSHDEVDVLLEGVLYVVVVHIVVYVDFLVHKIGVRILEAGTVVAAVAEVILLVAAVGHPEASFHLVPIESRPAGERTSGGMPRCRLVTRCMPMFSLWNSESSAILSSLTS